MEYAVATYWYGFADTTQLTVGTQKPVMNMQPTRLSDEIKANQTTRSPRAKL